MSITRLPDLEAWVAFARLAETGRLSASAAPLCSPASALPCSRNS